MTSLFTRGWQSRRTLTLTTKNKEQRTETERAADNHHATNYEANEPAACDLNDDKFDTSTRHGDIIPKRTTKEDQIETRSIPAMAKCHHRIQIQVVIALFFQIGIEDPSPPDSKPIGVIVSGYLSCGDDGDFSAGAG